MQRDPHQLQREVIAAAEQLERDLAALQRATGNWGRAEEARPEVAAALDRCLERLAATGLEGPGNQVPSRELWRIAGRRLETGWLQRRAREKPRGYAGDFELFDRIVRQMVCDDPLGRHFDTYFLAQHAPRAVCERTALVAEAIRQAVESRPVGEVRLLCLGCGPAAELTAALVSLEPAARSRIRATLLDLDPAAVEFAARRLAPWLEPHQYEVRRENLNRLAARPPTEATFDLIWSLGFFDYLLEKPFAALLRAMHAALKTGGRLLAFNFSAANPTRPYMEWIGNWYLQARTAEVLAELAAAAGLPRFEIEAEPIGINLYISAVRE